MKALGRILLGITIVLAPNALRADDLTGATKCLCSTVQATECLEGGDCEIDIPWNINIPEFVEIDLSTKKLSTTKASGQNRSTAIDHLSRQDGLIILQGFEKGRAFSFVITEKTGRIAAAIATEGRAVAVFGTCTPMPTAPVAAAK